MFSFIHTADIHLDSPLRNLEMYEGMPSELVRDATRRALENLVKLAIERKVNFVLIAGDLYDGDWRDFGTGLFFVRQMAILGEAGIPVYIVAGNHDAQNRITKDLRLPAKVYNFPTKGPATFCLDELNVAIHGQGFLTRATTSNLAVAYPAPLSGCFNIGLLHTAIDGREGHDPYAPCTVSDMKAKGYDYWALGHVHLRETVNENPYIVFPGNTQGRHVREAGAKGCMCVEVNDEGAAQLAFQPLDVIRWYACDITAEGNETIQDALDRAATDVAAQLLVNDERRLISRIRIQASESLHQRFWADPEKWIAEARSALFNHCGEDAWLEKLRISPAQPDNETVVEPESGAMAELDQLSEEVCGNPEELARWGGEIRELYAHLPQHLKEGEDAIAITDPDWIKRAISDSRQLLQGRIPHQRSVE